MRNFWLIAKEEYRRMVVRRGFVITTIAVPVGIAALIGITILVAVLGENNLPIGYVDKGNFLDEARQASLPDPELRIEIRGYPDETAAMNALEQEEIQAFFVLPADYKQTLHSDLFFLEKPPSNDTWGDFDDFIRLNLMKHLPGDVQNRLFEGPNITVRDISNNREFNENAVINFILPFAAGFFFYFSTVSAAGYLLSIIASEKENRTIEIMVSTVSPWQLIGGKAAGLLGGAITQLFIYVTTAVIGLAIASRYVEFLQVITIPWGYLGIVLFFFLPAYIFIAAVMVAIGGAVTDLQQGQQIAGILNLFFLVPMFMLWLIFQNPSHPLVVFMSIFPTTSFLTILLRWGLGTIPLWQVGVSWFVLVGTTVLMIWAAVKIFQVGMLRYGQSLNLKSTLVALKARQGSES